MTSPPPAPPHSSTRWRRGTGEGPGRAGPGGSGGRKLRSPRRKDGREETPERPHSGPLARRSHRLPGWVRRRRCLCPGLPPDWAAAGRLRDGRAVAAGARKRTACEGDLLSEPGRLAGAGGRCLWHADRLCGLGASPFLPLQSAGRWPEEGAPRERGVCPPWAGAGAGSILGIGVGILPALRCNCLPYLARTRVHRACDS